MNRKEKIYFILIFILGCFLRILNLGKHSFWCDEFLAISLGEHSIKWMIDYITYNDAHPPLFYILVHFWLKFGKNESSLRTLPLLFGILCIPTSYLFGEKIKNVKTALLFSLFIALSPPLILWSQIVKSYTLFTFLTIISFISFISSINSNEKKWFISLIITNILILYTHNFGFIVIFIQLFTLLILKKLNIKSFFLFLITFFIYIPWLFKIPHQLAFTLGVKRPIPIILRFPYTLFYFFFGETINPFNLKILIPLFLIYIWLFKISLNSFFLLERKIKTLLIISISFPLIFVVFPSTVPQNLIPFSIFWLLLFSLGLEKLSYRNILGYLPFFSLIPPLFFYYSDNINNYQDTSKLIPFREIYSKVENLERDGDLILTTEKIDKDIISPIQWYYKGKNEIIGINNLEDLEKINKMIEKSERFFIIFDFVNSPLISEKLREFFEKNYNKIYEKKYIYNEKLLSKLKGKKEFYYLVEVYLFKKF
jgi:4-amino-4-deoxy-L-arabinose transferase-like glycosyltransferase